MKIASKRAYSLLEVMVSLAIMAMAAAMIMPRAAGALDQVVAHTVFFDFQRQVLDLRRQAFAAVDPAILMSSPPSGGSEDAEMVAATASHARPIKITLRAGWTYQLSAPIRIGAGGICSRSDVDLYNAGRKIIHLQGQGTACRFIRVI